MISFIDFTKAAVRGSRLVPFFQAVGLYFAAGELPPSPSAAALKCAPVVWLLLAVAVRAPAAAPPQPKTGSSVFGATEPALRSPTRLPSVVTMGKTHEFSTKCVRRRYARSVAAGLALSAAGDALLVWRHLEAGMAAFAGAHAAYIRAFGLRPRRYCAALALLAGAALFLAAAPPPAALRAPAAAYALLLAAMAWRGVATAGPQRTGALLFLLSDAVLGYSLFAGPVPYDRVVVMSTYYAGQLYIARSALDQQPALEAH